ncbi:hypothetical protein IC762_12370 [Bradyrhizobium genosp. L]|uniref:hypothetical protein n=1 Tax=Bradyrhizobium genosp. L TaxID=83637 RepID=UPI0018A2850D|nr:hypothetical protein [Bradyrhizobium genosp. L]QPF87039.1 hypothetical protein IC762_12370 [Bradyrhizobium genosp. L]
MKHKALAIARIAANHKIKPVNWDAVRRGPWDKKKPHKADGGGVDDWVSPPVDDWISPEKPATPDKGVLSAAAHGLAQGASFNFSDEMMGAHAAGPSWVPEVVGPLPLRTMVGAGRTGLAYLTGKDPDAIAAYEKARDEERAANEEAQQQHPYAYTAAEIAGGAAIPVGAGATAATLPGRILRGALTGAGVGGLYGAGAGDTATDRLTGAATGSLAGAATGALAPPIVEGAIQGVSHLAQPAINTVRGLFNPEGEASRRVATALERDFQHQGPQVTPEEAAIAQAAGSPTAVIDAGGETTRALARSAANTSPEARQALSGLTQARFGTQNQRAADFVQRLTGAAGDNPADIEAIQAAARRVNRPAYERAYREGSAVWNDDLEQLSQAPAVQDAIRQATRTGANRAAAEGFEPVRNPFQFSPEGHMSLRTNADGSQALPSLQFWDHVKRNLDDQFTKLQRSGENSAARDVGDLRSQLLGVLDQEVPSFANARAGAARAFGAQDAMEAGANFVNSRMENADARRALGRMSAPERQLFQRGYASALINKIDEMGDRTTILNKLSSSPAERERMEIALGPQNSRSVEAFLRVEGLMDRARNAVVGNSTTARQLAELGLAGGAYGIASHGDLTDPRAVATGMLVYGLTRGNHAINERVARRVGEMLASNNPDVVQRGIQMIARHARILNGFRAMDNVGSRAAGQQSAKIAPAVQGPVPSRADDEKKKP